MEKLKEYLRTHRRETPKWVNLVWAVIGAAAAVFFFTRGSGRPYDVVAAVWIVFALVYLFRAFFRGPADRSFDPVAEAALREKEYREMLDAMDRAALEEALCDPKRSESFKVAVRQELARREKDA